MNRTTVTAPTTGCAELLAAITDPSGREILDPATGELVGRAPESTVADLDRALAGAREKQPEWAAVPDAERCAVLHRAADAIEAAAPALAELLSREQGKPVHNGPNALFEVGAAAAWLRATASLPLEPETLFDDESGTAVLSYEPVGVVGAISPWNWPIMISVWQIAPALRMGNTVVAKPSEYTPLSVLALAHVLAEALPEGLLTVVPGGREVGAALSGHPGVDKLMFTGSTATGKAIMRSAADSLTRLTLELGGNDAGIVLPDADARAIAEGLFWGAFINTGQTCAALKRLYVHEDVYDDVCEALTEVAAAMPMGEGRDERNVLGPLQNRAQFEIVAGLVEQARAGGGRVLIGGNPEENRPGHFYPTTLVADLDDDNPLVTQEQFGPALPIVKYSSVDDAVRMANRLDAGLGASVWSSDADRAREVAARVRAGTVWINKHGAVDPRMPFGGIKGSGFGVEFGVEGLKALGVPKVVAF
ncbi:aldehyde dehydrogenase family protein [Kocuria sp. M1R5S2]|uniref:aldehyde dehydrogenase family protein n=1 Tax=Kocuria rhizosphaerae TaxID=3376285 RepID=UPI0037BD51BE